MNPSTTNGLSSKTVTFTYPDGSTASFPANVTVGEVLKNFASPYPVVAAYVDNKIAPLERRLNSSAQIAPVHLGMRDGALIYRRSLSFVLVRAVQELYPSVRVYVNHSLSGGYYVELQPYALKTIDTLHVNQVDLSRIRDRMREIVASDEPFVRHTVTLEEAIALFEKNGQMEKAQLLRCCKNEGVSVYSCGGSTNHFYGYLVPSTGFLKVFDLVPEPPGFVLLFPSMSRPDVLPLYESQPKIKTAYQEYDRWMRILGLDSVAQLNERIERGEIREYILIAEALQEKTLARIADQITNSPAKPRIVLIAGPSASGKTTFMKRLSIQLRVNGSRPVGVSLDDFFVDRELTPKDDYGDYDFESFDSIDHRRFNAAILGLLRGEDVPMPRYDFKAGTQKQGPTLRLEPDQILVIEGIHGLNDNLLREVPDSLKFKIHVSPLTHLNIDEHNRIPSSDARLLRRLVRDMKFRGYGARDTLARWPSVRRGDEKNIFPHQERADVVFNSSLPYEIGALAAPAVQGLREVDRSYREYAEAARLLRFLSYFREIPVDDVPRHSLLREFLGGSLFTY